MAMAQNGVVHYELLLRMPENKIRVVAGGDGALAAGESGQTGGARAKPRGQPLGRVSPCPSSGPDRGKPKLERRDAAPGSEEIAILPELHRRWRRGMVAHNRVQPVTRQRLPQVLAVPRLSDRRGALELRGAVGNLFGGEAEVVRAGLRCHPNAFRASRGDQREGLGGRDVDDVDSKPPLAREADQESHRIRFRGDWAAGEPGGVGSPIARLRGGVLQRRRPLGVHHDQGVECRERGCGLLQVARRHGRKFGHPGGAQETLEPEHARPMQRSELGGVAGDQPAKEAGIDRAPAKGRGALDLEGRHVGGGRDAVERHVEQRGDAAGSCRTGSGRESLPLRPAGLVHVDVRVHQSGEDERVSRVHQVDAPWDLRKGAYPCDSPIGDVDRRCA
jgi:hypothetical protein